MSITETDPLRENGPPGSAAGELPPSAGAKIDGKAGPWRVAEAVKARVGNWRGRARSYAEGTREQLETRRDNALEVVREKPGTSTAATFGVGLVAGVLLTVVATRVFAGGAGAGARTARDAGRRAMRRLHS